MKEKETARPVGTSSDKAEGVAAAMGLPLHSGPYSDDEKKAILETAFPKGYVLLNPDDPAVSAGLPGKWNEINRVWVRVE